MSLGEKRYMVMDEGRKYRLSDGTEIEFLGRDDSGAVQGVSAEEVIAVLVDRMEHQRESCKGSRLISLAITALEEAENWLARWDTKRRNERCAA